MFARTRLAVRALIDDTDWSTPGHLQDLSFLCDDEVGESAGDRGTDRPDLGAPGPTRETRPVPHPTQGRQARG